MLITQLFDPPTFTFTYLLADPRSRQAALIDPVHEQLHRDLDELRKHDLQLRWVLETHVHADHTTSASQLRQQLGAHTLVSEHAGVSCADRLARDGDMVRLGDRPIEVRHTPGHTRGDLTFVLHDEGVAFTGDTLLIDGCGRTDFQGGCARALFRSVRDKIFTLPDTTRVFPGHDYQGRTSTTVGEQRRTNPRLRDGQTEAAFVALMAALDLPYPRQIDTAVPQNQRCGRSP